LIAPELLERLRSILDASQVLTDDDALRAFGTDATTFLDPAPSCVVLPRSTAQVRSIVRFANEHGVALVPSGGRTGLSGGALAASGEVVVAFDAMTRIFDFSPDDRTVRCEAGVITRDLQRFAEERDLSYPVEFAATGSSRIGGNVSTNAGGVRVIRYGMTRDRVAGLTVVTGRGDVLELNKGLVKNATGYDLRHLFIGAEGTLGFVTEATLRLSRAPGDAGVLVLGLDRMRDAIEALRAFRQRIDLTAFEFFSESALRHVLARGEHERPFPTPSRFYALLEFEAAGSGAAEDAASVFEECVRAGFVRDGVAGHGAAQARKLWRLREDISEAISGQTPYKNDISVTVSRLPAFLEEIERIVAERYPGFEIVWFGHIGDGNLHLNILKPADLPKDEFLARCREVNRWVFEAVQRHQGSISAEHGVGLLKKDYLGYSRSQEEIAYLKAIKAAFDPNNIMNPGKIFDP